MKLLHIDSSIQGPQSVSRELSTKIVAKLRGVHPDASVVRRDLVVDDLSHLSGAQWATLPSETADDTYIRELLDADVIVIGVPMYNFTVPTQLKSWIDRIAVAHKTFAYDASGVEGLVKGKKVYLASSRGGFYGTGTPTAFLDHQEPYLLGMLGFLGMTDVTVIRAEGINYGPEARSAAIAKADEAIAALAA